MSDIDPAEPDRPPSRTWAEKFTTAFRGWRRGFPADKTFRVHFAFTLAVVACASVMRMNPAQWGMLLLCATVVVMAELFNTAIEQLAKAVTDQPNERIRDALDISSGGVLFASCGAAIVGLIVFVSRLLELVGE